MADIASTLRSWSATAASNQPTDSTTIGSGLDDNLRQLQATPRQFLASPATNMASAATVDLSTADGYFILITGVTTITSFGTESAGIHYVLRFNAALTLTHNSTSLILPGGQNITTASGDVAWVVSEGSGNWRCLHYQQADGTTNNAASATVASATTVNAQTSTAYLQISGTTTIASILLNDGHMRAVQFQGALTLTHSSSLVLPGAADITTAAGDTAIFVGESGGVVRCLLYQEAVIPPRKAATVSVFTNTGSNSWAKPTGLSYIIVECYGAGGGGGDSGAAGQIGGGGGAGGYVKKKINAASVASSVTATVGAGGGNGASGGLSAFQGHCTATGGSAGTSGAAGVAFGGTGGTGVNGDINGGGDSGKPGVLVSSGTVAWGGQGGSSAIGGGGKDVGPSSNGNAGTGKGAGGGGACEQNPGPGGSGSNGVVVVWEHYA